MHQASASSASQQTTITPPSTAASSNNNTPTKARTLARKPSQQSLVEQVPPTSYNGQGSIQTMNELYEVGDVIGTGTFGVIRKVIRKSDGLILARKELDYGRMDERDLKQLSEEVNILQNLDPNENIVRYYERYVDRQKFKLHIIMEYCHNGDLASQIQRCRRKNTLLREDVVWSYLTQIALALSDCHAEVDSKGRPKQVILHRDIKPENVFLDRDNNIKLGDFGLSKAMASAAFTNTYVGTPYYMSPELINSQAYDQKSDIWALGCLIYELCAWHPPFHEARTQAELTKLIRDGRIPNLPSVYSKNLQDIVKSMLRQDPKLRPTIAQIKNMDEVKMQMRIAELRRMHEDLIHARKELEAREAAVSERERLVSIRERDLEFERNDLQNERVRLATAFSSMTLYSNPSSSSISGSSATSTAPSSRDNSPLVDQKENIGYINVGIGMPAPTGGNVGIQFPPDNNGHANANSMLSPSGATTNSEKTIARVASRPSLVPRRPLEERRSMIGLNTLSKRMSCQSLMAMAVDGETPVKSNSNLSTPGTETRRRIATSKSMHNLKSSGSSRLDQSPSRGYPPALPGLKQQHSYNQQQSHLQTVPQSPVHSTFNQHHSLLNRPASSAPIIESHQHTGSSSSSTFSKRSDSSVSLAIPSPSKRPGIATRTATAPPTLPSAGSMSSMSSYNGGIVPSITTTASSNNSHTGHVGGPGPKWNLEDEENLPSPFIKKKISAGPLRALVAQHSSTVSGGTSSGMSRGMSHGNLSSISSGTVSSSNGPPGVPTRAGRPSTTRQSLAGRLALHRQAKVDEQGRRLAAV